MPGGPFTEVVNTANTVLASIGQAKRRVSFQSVSGNIKYNATGEEMRRIKGWAPFLPEEGLTGYPGARPDSPVRLLFGA